MLQKFAVADDPFCIETDVRFLIVPLPGKVFMRAETASIISAHVLRSATVQRHAWAALALPANSGWDVDEPFYAAVTAGGVVSRTYLTHGWKYKARMLQNSVAEEMKAELIGMQLPRFVWVTEYGLPAESVDLDPCQRRIRAHVVVDATDSQFSEAPLIIDAPGLSVMWVYDPNKSMPTAIPTIKARLGSTPYWPKIRGRTDYENCASP